VFYESQAPGFFGHDANLDRAAVTFFADGTYALSSQLDGVAVWGKRGFYKGLLKTAARLRSGKVTKPSHRPWVTADLEQSIVAVKEALDTLR
jgi:hypothetical protein